MIRIAVVDDNAISISEVKELLKKYASEWEYETYEYSSAESFLNEIDKVFFDIVYLDIILGDKSGIDVGKILNEKQSGANVIFMSMNPEYFKDVYKVTHSYFLIKDFEEDRFADAISKALANIKRDVITINNKDGKHKIILNDVMFFEGYSKHTKVHFKDGEIIQYNNNIKEIETFLPEKDFVRTHQSFIVNMNHIKKYSRSEVCFDFEKTVPISRSYVASAREKITCFLGGMI